MAFPIPLELWDLIIGYCSIETCAQLYHVDAKLRWFVPKSRRIKLKLATYNATQRSAATLVGLGLWEILRRTSRLTPACVYCASPSGVPTAPYNWDCCFMCHNVTVNYIYRRMTYSDAHKNIYATRPDVANLETHGTVRYLEHQVKTRVDTRLRDTEGITLEEKLACREVKWQQTLTRRRRVNRSAAVNHNPLMAEIIDLEELSPYKRAFRRPVIEMLEKAKKPTDGQCTEFVDKYLELKRQRNLVLRRFFDVDRKVVDDSWDENITSYQQLITTLAVRVEQTIHQKQKKKEALQQLEILYPHWVRLDKSLWFVPTDYTVEQMVAYGIAKIFDRNSCGNERIIKGCLVDSTGCSFGACSNCCPTKGENLLRLVCQKH